jgi:ParB-like chromosome segregation protein Spo0J
MQGATLQMDLLLSGSTEERNVSKSVGKKKIDKIVAKCTNAFGLLDQLSLDDRVEAINGIREALSAFSPFSSEPVDFVRWVASADVHANDYNPNSVAPPEMELLRLSIMADGYTQPIVTNKTDGLYEVIDGFHRNRVGKECKDVQERVNGYLPVVQIKTSQTDKGDRMASTIRHNRARGKHRVEAMSDIVLELRRRNWSNDKIGRQLGMDPDEVLRLAQITGLAEMFSDREFSQAWEPVSQGANDEIGDLPDEDDDIGSEIDGAL